MNEVEWEKILKNCEDLCVRAKQLLDSPRKTVSQLCYSISSYSYLLLCFFLSFLSFSTSFFRYIHFFILFIFLSLPSFFLFVVFSFIVSIDITYFTISYSFLNLVDTIHFTHVPAFPKIHNRRKLIMIYNSMWNGHNYLQFAASYKRERKSSRISQPGEPTLFIIPQ